MVNKKVIKIKEEDDRITFSAGSAEVKKEARELAKNFKPIKISLSDFCQIALKEFMKKVLKGPEITFGLKRKIDK